jgi:hypothetical protein
VPKNDIAARWDGGKFNGGENMANPENLIPGGHTFTQEEASKGGKASGEVRRLRAAVKRVLEISLPNEMGEIKEALKNANVATTNDNGIAFAIVLKALNGDLSAATRLRDTIGEKPKEELSLGGDAVVIISGDDKIAD